MPPKPQEIRMMVHNPSRKGLVSWGTVSNDANKTGCSLWSTAHGSEIVDTQWYCLLITSILHQFKKNRTTKKVLQTTKKTRLTATDGRISVKSTLHDKSTNKIRFE